MATETKTLAEIKQMTNRDLDGSVDENTLVSGETSSGVFGVFKFFDAIKELFSKIVGSFTSTTTVPTNAEVYLRDGNSSKKIKVSDLLNRITALEASLTNLTVSGTATFNGSVSGTGITNKCLSITNGGSSGSTYNGNLNDLKTIGMYAVASNTGTPTTDTYYGTLEVYKGVYNYITQLLTITTNRTFIRIYNISSWTDWQEVALKSDLANLYKYYDSGFKSTPLEACNAINGDDFIKEYVPLIFNEVLQKNNGNGNGIFNNGGPNVHYSFFKTNDTNFTIEILSYLFSAPIWLWRKQEGYKVITIKK